MWADEAEADDCGPGNARLDRRTRGLSSDDPACDRGSARRGRAARASHTAATTENERRRDCKPTETPAPPNFARHSCCVGRARPAPGPPPFSSRVRPPTVDLRAAHRNRCFPKAAHGPGAPPARSRRTGGRARTRPRAADEPRGGRPMAPGPEIRRGQRATCSAPGTARRAAHHGHDGRVEGVRGGGQRGPLPPVVGDEADLVVFADACTAKARGGGRARVGGCEDRGQGRNHRRRLRPGPAAGAFDDTLQQSTGDKC